MLSNVDIQYSALVDQLQILNNKLDQFINGDATVTIATTNGGVIKSLAGIVKDLYASAGLTPPVL